MEEQLEEKAYLQIYCLPISATNFVMFLIWDLLSFIGFYESKFLQDEFYEVLQIFWHASLAMIKPKKIKFFNSFKAKMVSL